MYGFFILSYVTSGVTDISSNSIYHSYRLETTFVLLFTVMGYLYYT